MIVFDSTTWTISLPPGESPIARQYDNLTRSIVISGVPDGWAWTLLVQASGKLDIIDLDPVEGGVGVNLTAQMLALSGFYTIQLRGTQGDLVRHTNVLQVLVPKSLSGSATWPTVPSEFTQLEQRVQALAAETETAADQAQAAAEGVAANAQAAQEAAGQAQTAQDAAQSSAQQAGTAAAAAADGAKTAADSAAAATQAAQSAGDAVRSAQASAQTATAQAQSAADAAQQAGQAKTAAEAAAGSAEQSAANADRAAQEAQQAAQDAQNIIDDTKAQSSKTWSSLTIVDRLAPAFEVSGPVVTCNPVEGYPLHVVSQIVPVQEGEGDPSPDNVRPIKGWDGVNLYHSGKNLFNILGDVNRDYYGKPTPGYNLVDDGILTANTNSDATHLKGQIIPVKKGIPVIITYDLLDIGTGLSGYVAVYELGIPKAQKSSQSMPGEQISMTYTPETDVILLGFGTRSGVGAKYKNISLTFQSEGNEYEPYRGKTITLPFGQTVYGGTLDLKYGKVRDYSVLIKLTGAESIVDHTYSGKPGFVILDVLKKSSNNINGLCSHAKIHYGADIEGAYMWLGVNTRHVYWIGGSEATNANTIAEFKSYLSSQYNAGTPVTIFYQEQEDDYTEFEINSTEILALSGTNTLYTDTGDTSVSGRADPSAVIQQLAARIAALEGAATQI